MRKTVRRSQAFAHKVMSCRQQHASTSGMNGISSSAVRSIADRRPWWPLGHSGDAKLGSDDISSSSGTRPQRALPALRQTGISLAPSLAPANGSIADDLGTAPAEARPREESASIQQLQPERRHDSALLSPAQVSSDRREVQSLANSTKAAEPPSHQPRCRPAQELGSARTALAQHFAAHGPPKLIFFDLESTGAMLFLCDDAHTMIKHCVSLACCAAQGLA